MDQQLQACRECYAYVADLSRHRRWHTEMERSLKDLEAKIRRLK